MSKQLFAISAAAIAVTLPAAMPAAADNAPGAESPPYRSFFADRKAFHKGDMLTVIITEATEASSTARTRTDKSDRVSASLAHEGPVEDAISLGASNQFNGGGEIQRTGRLLGKLTAVVTGIDAAGNLAISGEQTILINNEQQRIALHGVVRPEDIAPDNTLPSWRIAAAQIEFKGKGILARKQSPGLLAKLFDLFGLN